MGGKARGFDQGCLTTGFNKGVFWFGVGFGLDKSGPGKWRYKVGVDLDVGLGFNNKKGVLDWVILKGLFGLYSYESTRTTFAISEN